MKYFYYWSYISFMSFIFTSDSFLLFFHILMFFWFLIVIIVLLFNSIWFLNDISFFPIFKQLGWLQITMMIWVSQMQQFGSHIWYLPHSSHYYIVSLECLYWSQHQRLSRTYELSYRIFTVTEFLFLLNYLICLFSSFIENLFLNFG